MDIESGVQDGVMRICINRPDKKNALTGAMYKALTAALQAGEDDAAVRAMLITGAGGVFTAGNDLEDFLNNTSAGLDTPAMGFLYRISTVSKPVVAAVQGAAIGIGTTMLLHCDLVYAADNARFSMPFTQLGLAPEGASSLLLPRLAGYQNAAEKLLLGEPFDAAEAHRIGLVNQVVAPEALAALVEQKLARLRALPAASLRLTKRFIKDAEPADVRTRLESEFGEFVKRLQSPEAKEAFTAFLQKRKPDFSQFD